MNVAKVNLVALAGRGGYIGSSGQLAAPMQSEDARQFQNLVFDMCRGGMVILGGRTHRMMVENGMKPQNMPFEIMVWDRKMQSIHSPDSLLSLMAIQGTPIFILGGRYTFECFAPHVEQMFITRTPLQIGPHPLFMPNLFGITQ